MLAHLTNKQIIAMLTRSNRSYIAKTIIFYRLLYICWTKDEALTMGVIACAFFSTDGLVAGGAVPDPLHYVLNSETEILQGCYLGL